MVIVVLTLMALAVGVVREQGGLDDGREIARRR